MEPVTQAADPRPRPWSLSRADGALRATLADLRADRLTLALAVAIAAITLIFVAHGLTVSRLGGVLRIAPYASLVLGPAVVGLAVVRPWNGLVAWVLFQPALNIARVTFLAGPFQLILTTFVVLAVALGLWRQRVVRREGPGFPPLERWAWVVVGCIVVLAIASTAAVASNLARALPIAVHGLIEPVLLSGLVVSLRPTRRQLAALAAAIGISVALATVFNLVRIVAVAGVLAGSDEQRIQLARLTYYNVGIFGDMLTMGLPLIVAGLLLRRALGIPRWGVALLAAGLVVSLLGLYLTFTKSAWLGALASCALLALLLLAPTRRRQLAIAAAALLLSATVIPYPSFVLHSIAPAIASRYEQLVSVVNSRSATIDPGTPEGEVSVTERVYATVAGLRMAVDHPILGVGPGQFATQYEHRYRSTSATRYLDSAHNLLVYVAAEFGLPIATMVVLGLGAALLLAWRTMRRARDLLDHVLSASILAALVGFLVVGLTFGVDLYRDYRMVNSDVTTAALLVGAALALREAAGRQGDRQEVSGPREAGPPADRLEEVPR